MQALPPYLLWRLAPDQATPLSGPAMQQALDQAIAATPSAADEAAYAEFLAALFRHSGRTLPVKPLGRALVLETDSTASSYLRGGLKGAMLQHDIAYRDGFSGGFKLPTQAEFAPGATALPPRPYSYQRNKTGMPQPVSVLAAVMRALRPSLDALGLTRVEGKQRMCRAFRRWPSHCVSLRLELRAPGPYTLHATLGVQVPALSHWKARLWRQELPDREMQRESLFWLPLPRWMAAEGLAHGLMALCPPTGEAMYQITRMPEATQVGEHLASRVLSDLPPLLDRSGSLDDLEALLNRPLQSSPFYSKPARAGMQVALAALLERADWPQLAESLEQAMQAARPAQHHVAQDLQSQDELRCAEILGALRGRLPFSARERQLAREIAWLD